MPIIRRIVARSKTKAPPPAKVARNRRLAKRIVVGDNHIHKPYFRKPKFLKPSKVSLGRLMLRSFPADMREALSVQLSSIKRGKPVKVGKRTLNQLRGTTTTDENGHIHNITIMYEGDKIDKNTPVTVDCTCARHAFYWEFANAQRGLSPIFRCNGEPPVQTNPSQRISGCKHVLRVAGYVLKNYRKFSEK